MALNYYVLQGFKGNAKVIANRVAIVPGAASYPRVGQTIDDKWRAVEILKSSEGELHVRVEPLEPGEHK